MEFRTLRFFSLHNGINLGARCGGYIRGRAGTARRASAAAAQKEPAGR